jgi:Icc-related predicted phosphoesterase
MRVHVVSDVHGRADALRRAGDGADALICLGDLLLFIDYADHSQGIFPDLFGAENARTLVELRSAGRFDEARSLSGQLWAGLDGDPRAHIEAAVAKQYAELFAAMPVPSYLTYGNVDLPRLWEAHVRPGQRVLDGERIELDGWAFGFVGGGLRTAYRTPNELLYDTVARRVERGSEALLDVIRTTQPRYVLFGHVHQPLQSRIRIGATECINVGHFRARGLPYLLQWG